MISSEPNTFNGENVNIFFSETQEPNANEDLTMLIDEFYTSPDYHYDAYQDAYDLNMSLLIDYSENNTVKQLIRICEYYGISKENKLSKAKKIDIVNAIMLFENEACNIEIVMKRKRMWHYISELKNDRHMKQYIFWS